MAISGNLNTTPPNPVVFTPTTALSGTYSYWGYPINLKSTPSPIVAPIDAYLLPPMVKAYYSTSLKQLTIDALVYIDTPYESGLDFSVYYGGFYLRPLIGISFKSPGPNISEMFYSYQIVANYTLQTAPDTIECFLINTDPKASRGTVTTVQTVE